MVCRQRGSGRAPAVAGREAEWWPEQWFSGDQQQGQEQGRSECRTASPRPPSGRALWAEGPGKGPGRRPGPKEQEAWKGSQGSSLRQGGELEWQQGNTKEHFIIAQCALRMAFKRAFLFICHQAISANVNSPF